MEDEELDYQVDHDVDNQQVNVGGDDEEFIEFEMEAEAVFKRLASDIYESEEAGIREPLTNSATAIIRAREEYGLADHEGVIQIELHKESDGNRLVIQDNGIGITDAELREVLAVIGRSMNRNREDLSGQFGMGFLALWMLSGLDGGFIMSTRSRATGERISGVWKSGGFSRVDPEALDDSLAEGQYGTRLNIALKESISAREIRNWVAKHAEWCRVPVSYREFDANGSEDFNEDYGNKNVEDQLDEDDARVVLDTEYFRAVSADSCQGKAILLDVPLNRGKRYIRGTPFSEVNIRMKVESGIVVDGPHEGLIPVSENEYRQMDEERQEKYIPENRIAGNDVVMPAPTGTRDKLDSAPEFWGWLGDQLWDVYNEEAASYFEQIDSPSDLYDLSKSELSQVAHATQHLKGSNTSIKSELKSKYGVKIDNELNDAVRALTKSVGRAPRGSDPDTTSNRRDRLAAKVAWDAKGGDRDGDVFMGVSLNAEKAGIAWEDNEHNQVVAVEDTDEYDLFENLGWRKLKEIKRSNIEEFDVSEETAESFAGDNDTSVSAIHNPDQRELTLHFDSRRRSNQKTDAKTIKSEFERYASGDNEPTPNLGGYRSPKRIVLFPSSTDRKLTDHYWLANDDTALTTCSVSVAEYLSDTENIHIVDDYIESAEEYEVNTSEGKMKVKDATENTIFHVVPEASEDLFKDEERMNLFGEFLAQNLNGGYSTPNVENDTAVYAPITMSEYRDIRPAMRGNTVVVGDLRSPDVGQAKSLTNDTRVYAYARLPEWHDTTEMERLTNLGTSLDNGGYDLIETLAQLHDAGIDPNSLDDEHDLSK